MSDQTGKVLGMLRKAKPGADIEKIDMANVTVEKGINGDARGTFENAQITLISKEAWDAAMADLQPTRDVDWSSRRANIFIEGLDLNQSTGARITIGDVELEVKSETDPCEIMNKAYPGLKDALTPDWRGGCRTKVLTGGIIKVGDMITMRRD